MISASALSAVPKPRIHIGYAGSGITVTRVRRHLRLCDRNAPLVGTLRIHHRLSRRYAIPNESNEIYDSGGVFQGTLDVENCFLILTLVHQHHTQGIQDIRRFTQQQRLRVHARPQRIGPHPCNRQPKQSESPAHSERARPLSRSFLLRLRTLLAGCRSGP